MPTVQLLLLAFVILSFYMVHRAQRHLRNLYQMTTRHNRELVEFLVAAYPDDPQVVALIRHQVGEMREMIEKGG